MTSEHHYFSPEEIMEHRTNFVESAQTVVRVMIPRQPTDGEDRVRLRDFRNSWRWAQIAKDPLRAVLSNENWGGRLPTRAGG